MTFPAPNDICVNMMPFYWNDINSVPIELQPYVNAIRHGVKSETQHCSRDIGDGN